MLLRLAPAHARAPEPNGWCPSVGSPPPCEELARHRHSPSPRISCDHTHFTDHSVLPLHFTTPPPLRVPHRPAASAAVRSGMSQVRGTRVWVRTAQSALLGAERTMTAPRPRLAADRALSSAAVAATSLAIQAGSSPVRCVSRRCFAAGASPAPFGSGWFDAVTKGDSMVGMLPEIQCVGVIE